MPNILITQKCNQECDFCFAEKGNKEMLFENYKQVLDFLGVNKEKKVRLLGGEPTSHSDFFNFIDYTLKNNFDLQIFTNGIFSGNILKFLRHYDGKVKYSFNVNQPDFYNSKVLETIKNNIRMLAKNNECLIGRVVDIDSFNVDYLIELCKNYNMKTVILRIANYCYDKEKKELSRQKIIEFRESLVIEIKKINKSGLSIGFGCGLNNEIIDKETEDRIKNYIKKEIKFNCDANSGGFDIDHDLSVFRCLPLHNLNKKKLLDFNNVNEIKKYYKLLAESRNIICKK